MTTGRTSPAPSAPGGRCFRVLAREALAVARCGGAAQLSFAAIASLPGASAPPGRMAHSSRSRSLAIGGGEPLDRVRIAVASRSDPGSACRIDHSHAPAIAACAPSLSLAVSARLMPVTHRPKPVRSPENRWPQGPEISSVLLPSRGSHPRTGDGLSISMCSMS